MSRYVIISKATQRVLNAIEADETFIQQTTHFVDYEGNIVKKEDVEVVQSDNASVGDLIVEIAGVKKVFRESGNL